MWDSNPRKHFCFAHLANECFRPLSQLTLFSLAEIQGIEPSTFRWQSFQDSLSTLLAYLRSLVAVAGDAPVLLVMSQLWHFSTTPQKITIWQVRYLAIHLSGSSLPILLLSVNYSDSRRPDASKGFSRLSLPHVLVPVTGFEPITIRV